MARRYAIIPARGGSKRIPRKNLRPFLGVPILQRTIEKISRTGFFEEIFVSTEDAEIREFVAGHGVARLADRPTKLAGDFATTADVMRDFIRRIEGIPDKDSARYLTVYPTSVSVRIENILHAESLIEPGKVELVFAAARFPSEIQRAWWKQDDGTVKEVMPGFQESRSQDLRPAFFDAGQFYWSTIRGWELENMGTYVHRRLYEISSLEAIDINSEEDWAFAEALHGGHPVA